VPSADPTVIRSLAVTAEDVVAALGADRRRAADAVLRVTPPFSGLMRARLHRADVAVDDPAVIHVPPERVVDSPPPMPTADDTEDAVRADPAVAHDRRPTGAGTRPHSTRGGPTSVTRRSNTLPSRPRPAHTGSRWPFSADATTFGSQTGANRSTG
jgi:hypothetical protein